MKRILCLLISTIMIISSMGIVGSAADYNGHWAQSSIDALISDGVVSGDTSGSVRPDDNITRGEYVKVINKYFGYTEKANANFADVNSSKWYADEFLIAKQAGYITGDQNGNANPEANITRAEVCVIMARILKLPNNYNVYFNDSYLIPDWAKGAIGAMYSAGLISGYEDGTVKAEANITRAESFTLVVRNDRTAAGPSSQGTAVGGNISIAGGAGGGGGGGAGGGYNPPFDAGSNAASVSISGVNGKKVSFTASNAASFDIKVEVGGSEYNYANVAATTLSNGYEIDFTSVIAQTATTRGANRETYKMSIKAVGVSGYSDSAYAEFYNAMAIYDDIDEPENLNAIYNHNGSAYEPNKYKLTWDTVANSSKYIVTVFKTDELKTEDILYTNANVASNSEIADLTAKTPQELEKAVFVVQAVINNVPSDFSESKQLLLDGPVVTGVTYDASAHKYNVTYNAVTGATGYKVRFAGVETAVDTDGNMSTLFEVPVTTEGLTGTVEVMAICDSNASGYTPYLADIAFAGGSGTSTDPYLIDDARHFGNIGANDDNSSAKYKQLRDITGITKQIPSFTGEYDGDDYYIDIALTVADKQHGLFLIATGATIKNLTVKGKVYSALDKNSSGNGITNVGVLVGNSSGSTIENCVNEAHIVKDTEGNLARGNYFGGFAGYSDGATVFKDCTNKGTFDIQYGTVGGFVGTGGGKFYNCDNLSNLSSREQMAGFISVGTEDMLFEKCSNRGDITVSQDYAGAVAAFVASAKGSKSIIFKESYNTGEINLNNGNQITRADYDFTPAAIFVSRVTESCADYIVIENCYNVGNLVAHANEARAALVSAKDEIVVKVNVSNYYDLKNTSLDLVSNANADSDTISENVFVSNSATLENTLAEFDPTIWKLEGEYNFPQLINNPHIGDAVTPDPGGSGGGGGGTPPTPPTGPGSSAENPIKITSKEVFESYFSANGANADKIDDGLYFEQTASLIELGEWEPNKTSKFIGSYDGNGNKITYTISSTSATNNGLFANAYHATFKEMDVEGNITSNKNTNAVIAASANGSVFVDCISRGRVDTQSGGNYNGGIVGSYGDGTEPNSFTDCVNYADLPSKYGHQGGIAGRVFGTFENCTNYGELTISHGGDAGGIVGRLVCGTDRSGNSLVADGFDEASVIRNCVNNGRIGKNKQNSNASNNGGIVAYTSGHDSVIIEKCLNNGVVAGYSTTSNQGYIGGILGTLGADMNQNGTLVIRNCYNLSKVQCVNNDKGELTDTQIGNTWLGSIIGANLATVGTVTITSVYDAANSTKDIINAEKAQGTEVLEYVYIVGSTDPQRGITEEDIKADLPEGFSSDIWESNGESYPQFKAK